MFMRFVLSRFLLAGMVLVGVSSLAFAGEEASTDAPPAPASNPLTPFSLKNPPTYAAPGFAGTSPSSYTPPDIPNDYDGAMQYGIASFQLGDFVEVDKKLKEFNFSFRVQQRNFMLELESLPIESSSIVSIWFEGCSSAGSMYTMP